MRVVRAGWVYRGGYTGGCQGGLYRGTTHRPRGAVPGQRSGPRTPCRGGSGWSWGCGRAPAVFGGGDGYPHPPGPVGQPRAALPGIPLECRLWAKRARFHDISYKVSQNDEVSPKYHEKACHSPCLQNGLRKSPLEILRFPILRAFSHKELMGLF